MQKNFNIHFEADSGYISILAQDQNMTYAPPWEAKIFVETTGITALIITVGTAKRFYKEEPSLK